MNCGRWSTPLDTFARASYHMPKKVSRVDSVMVVVLVVAGKQRWLHVFMFHAAVGVSPCTACIFHWAAIWCTTLMLPFLD